MDLPGTPYDVGDAYVGEDRRYFNAGGTSFAAPLVAGVASLIMSHQPELTAEEVERMLVNSARDIETPGRDNLAGYGVLDARAALAADPAFFLDAEITGVNVISDAQGQPVVQVLGTANGDRLKSYRVTIGAGQNPDKFSDGSDKAKTPVSGGVVGEIPAQLLMQSTVWTLRLEVEHNNGEKREARFELRLG